MLYSYRSAVCTYPAPCTFSHPPPRATDSLYGALFALTSFIGVTSPSLFVTALCVGATLDCVPLFRPAVSALLDDAGGAKSSS